MTSAWTLRVAMAIMTTVMVAIVHAFEPNMLLSAATSPGSLVPSAKLVVLPNAKGPSTAAHYFVDNQQALADTVSAWLAEQKL